MQGRKAFFASPTKNRPAETRGFYGRQLSLDVLLEHIERRGRLGIEPRSIGAVVMDIDHGDADHFIQNFRAAIYVQDRRLKAGAMPVLQTRWREGQPSALRRAAVPSLRGSAAREELCRVVRRPEARRTTLAEAHAAYPSRKSGAGPRDRPARCTEAASAGR